MKISDMMICCFVTGLTFTACCGDDHETNHPDHGKITVTADWSNRGEGVDVPAEWVLAMGDYTGVETSPVHEPDRLFTPGRYTLAAYNIPDGISVNGTKATVAEGGDGVGASITGATGWLFTSVQEVTIEADTDYELTAAMLQQMRELTLVIEPTGDAADRIESIEGSLGGAAGTLDFATGTYGAPSNVALHFTKITEGSSSGKWAATVRLLGITGNTQTLTATLTYSDGNPADTGLESDLTAALADFNADKTVPLTLGGTMAETPTEAGMEAAITNWEKIDGGGVDAEM